MQHEVIQQQDVIGRKKIGQRVRERKVAGCKRMETRDWGKAALRNRRVRYCMLETCAICWESTPIKLYRGWK